MKSTPQQRTWRKKLREERKQIEKQLHPSPKMNGLDILHEHQTGNIYFTAWDGNNPLKNGKRFIVTRQEVLRHTIPNEFYMLYEKDLKWLTQSGY